MKTTKEIIVIDTNMQMIKFDIGSDLNVVIEYLVRLNECFDSRYYFKPYSVYIDGCSDGSEVDDLGKMVQEFTLEKRPNVEYCKEHGLPWDVRNFLMDNKNEESYKLLNKYAKHRL